MQFGLHRRTEKLKEHLIKVGKTDSKSAIFLLFGHNLQIITKFTVTGQNRMRHEVLRSDSLGRILELPENWVEKGLVILGKHVNVFAFDDRLLDEQIFVQLSHIDQAGHNYEQLHTLAVDNLFGLRQKDVVNF